MTPTLVILQKLAKITNTTIFEDYKIVLNTFERYENFEEAIEIHQHLLNTYKRFGYDLIDVPFGKVETRANFILESLNLQ